MSDYLRAKIENVQKLLDNCLKKQKQEFILDFLQELESINAFIAIIKTKLEEKLK